MSANLVAWSACLGELLENTELQLQTLYLFTKDSNVNCGKSKKRLILRFVGVCLGRICSYIAKIAPSFPF